MCKVVTTEDGTTVLRDDWYPEDIIMVAEQLGKEPTDGQVMEIMEVVADRFDANIGINWLVVESAIEMVMGDGEHAEA